MSSDRVQAHWDRILSAPPSMEELASDFPGYSFDTSGWGEDQEIEARVPMSNTPSHPKVDLTSFATPQRGLPTLDTAYITPLNDLNSFPPFPPINADEQHQQLPYVPAALRAQHLSGAAEKYLADVGVDAGTRWRQQMAASDDNVQQAVGNGGGEERGEKAKEKKRGRPKKDKENDSCDGDSGNKKTFTGDDLIMIARAAIDVNPFIAPHGQKGSAWQQVVDNLEAQNFRHKTISAASIQHKVEAMISFKKNPNGKHKNLANVIGEGTSASITIGALLERLETNFDAAKDKSDEAKAKLKKKNDEDRDGGEAIRQASMGGLRKRARSPASDDDTDHDVGTPRSRPADSSLDALDSDSDDSPAKGKKPSKRRRGMRRSHSGDADDLLALMKVENERRAVHDKRVAESLETFVSDSREQKKEFTSLLRELVANDRKAE
ncbi:hypothetical protein R3P38DRAFT_3242393 [Favolaschia claudopus]|uniref:Uncharacterized protein n=1 Tax=Favolaschia claudopus TaxID=2862362 RepID=A0AAV9Z4E3_9AGAR